MKNLCFTSVAFGDRYVEQQARLRESILKIYPDANLVFWTENLPSGAASFHDSLYGFKPHAVSWCRTYGFDRVVWLDPAMILLAPIDSLLDKPMIAVKDDQLLWDVTSDKVYGWYNIKKEDVRKMEWHLVGGSFYYFDFSVEVTCSIFNQWMTAELDGLFGSQQEAASEQLQGHRYDETLMAFSIYMHGLQPYFMGDVGYLVSDNLIFDKKHFK